MIMVFNTGRNINPGDTVAITHRGQAYPIFGEMPPTDPYGEEHQHMVVGLAVSPTSHNLVSVQITKPVEVCFP